MEHSHHQHKDEQHQHSQQHSHDAHDKHAGHHTKDFLKRFWNCLVINHTQQLPLF